MNQLERLWDYQQADVEADQMMRSIARSPQRMKLMKLRDDIQAQQAFLSSLENDVAAMLDRVDVLQEAISMSEDQLKQLQQRVQSAPARDSQQAREYVQEAQKLIASLQDYDQETRRIRQNAEERGKKQRTVKRLAFRLKTEFDALREEYNAKYQVKAEELKKLRAAADEKAKDIDPAFLEKYNIIKQHSVPPLAKLVNDRCSGCNMSFPAAVLQDIKSGKEVECETCGRLIIL